MLSTAAWRASAFLAPFFPSARSSAARCLMAERSSALKPSDSLLVFAGMIGTSSPGSANGVCWQTLRPARGHTSRFLLGSSPILTDPSEERRA